MSHQHHCFLPYSCFDSKDKLRSAADKQYSTAQYNVRAQMDTKLDVSRAMHLCNIIFLLHYISVNSNIFEVSEFWGQGTTVRHFSNCVNKAKEESEAPTVSLGDNRHLPASAKSTLVS